MVTHVLVDCPRLTELRRELGREVGDTFTTISSLLGGLTKGKKGYPDIISQARTVKAVLDFTEVS